jgi:cytochrome P450
LEYDAPIHTEYRKLFLDALNRKVVEANEPFIRAQAESLFEPLVVAGGGNVMNEVALPLTFNSMAQLMGASANFRKLAPELFETFGVNMANDDGIRAMVTIKDLLYEEIQIARRETRDGFIKVLLDGRIEDGRPLSEEELVNSLMTFGFAGYETTMSLLGSITVLLGRDPTFQDKVRTDNSLIPAALEEALRLYPSGHSQCRTVKAETELGGRSLQPGDKVMMMLAAANRDPRKFEDPDKFDLNRPNVRQHLSFGLGAHFCAGSHLARAESRIYTETLLNRCPPFAFDQEVDFGPLRAGHLLGWEHVLVEFVA